MIKIKCKRYDNDLKIVNSIRSLITPKNEHVFFAVLVHGSVATNELVKFSDFDGLIILNEGYKNSKALKNFIKNSMKEIYKFDPLQHHGWFIITKNQLQQYPQTYFPHELYKKAKVIYPNRDIFFNINFEKKSINYADPLFDIISSFENSKKNKLIPKNIYQLKSTLSKIMLLPTLYIQARDKKGVFKKDSFNLAKTDFKKEHWKPIEVASILRQEWCYEYNFLQLFFSRFQHSRFTRFIYKNYLNPKLEPKAYDLINELLHNDLDNLLNEMKSKIENTAD